MDGGSFLGHRDGRCGLRGGHFLGSVDVWIWGIVMGIAAYRVDIFMAVLMSEYGAL